MHEPTAPGPPPEPHSQPPAIWLRAAAILDEHNATHCTIDDVAITAADDHGNALPLNITSSPADVDAVLALLARIDPTPDDGTPASRFIRNDFTYCVLKPPEFQRRIIRLRRWRPSATWTLIP